jgi:hypothetical protein
MSTRIQLRRDTSTNWTRNNPVLAVGEPGIETDTGIVKYGDGVTAWNGLPYANLNSLADFTTTTLAEGSNLYYTNARVYANVISLNYASNSYVNTRLDTKANISDITTSNSYVNARLDTKANVSDLTTANVIELTNLYFSNSRVYANVELIGYSSNAYVNTRLDTKANVLDLNTSSIVEGSNLYFTNERVFSNVESLGYASNAYVNSRIDNQTFNSLIDVGNASFTVDLIAIPSVSALFISSNANANFAVNSHYGETVNPNIYVISGTTFAFKIQTDLPFVNPFCIQENSGSGWSNVLVSISHINTNGTLSNSLDAQGKTTGTMYFRVPFGTANVFRYISLTNPSTHVGNIIVKDIASI